MDLIDFILSLVIGLAVFSQAIKWLIEQIKDQGTIASPLPRRRADRLPPVAEDEVTPAEIVAAPRPSSATPAGRAPAGVPLSAAAQRGERLRRQLGLDERSALQRSVLLMTILGPCRANERGTGPRPD